jgi:hypothetical protein
MSRAYLEATAADETGAAGDRHGDLRSRGGLHDRLRLVTDDELTDLWEAGAPSPGASTMNSTFASPECSMTVMDATKPVLGFSQAPSARAGCTDVRRSSTPH